MGGSTGAGIGVMVADFLKRQKAQAEAEARERLRADILEAAQGIRERSDALVKAADAEG